MSVTEIDILDDIEIEDAPTVTTLSLVMQSIARNYLAARGRAGEAILDSARYLAEARANAKYGEWGIFLEATGTQEDTANRMIAIATRADADQQYALAVRDGRLALTAAFEILNAPAEVQQRVIESSTPTPAKAIKQAKQESKLRTNAEFVPAPALPSADDAKHQQAIDAILSRPHTPAMIQQAYDHAAEIHDLALHNKMIEVIDLATDDPPPPPPISAPVGDPLPPKLIALALSDLDATLPKQLSDAGYYWQSAVPPIIAHNDGWRGDAPTVALALEAASDRERARGTPRMIALPPFPATDLPALMAAITQLVKVVNAWSPDAQRKVAPAIGMIKAIGRKALEATS